MTQPLSVKLNILVIVLITVLCFILFHQSDVLDGAGMAALFLNWMPTIVGIGTLVLYLLVNMITKKYGWIDTILGCLLNVILVIVAFVE